MDILLWAVTGKTGIGTSAVHGECDEGAITERPVVSPPSPGLRSPISKMEGGEGMSNLISRVIPALTHSDEAEESHDRWQSRMWQEEERT